MERHPQMTVRVGDTLSAGRVDAIEHNGVLLQRLNNNGRAVRGTKPFLISFEEAEHYIK